jgi:ribosomal protein L7/L12
MSAVYSLILRACPDSSREAVAQLLGRAFSLKDSTCVSIAGSTPIILLTELAKKDAAALSLVMAGLEHHGAQLEFTADDVSELPKIDWPRRPLVFKRDINEYVGEYDKVTLPLPGSDKNFTILDLLLLRLDPQSRPVGSARGPSEFRGAQLPEITPFANQALPSSPTPTPVRAPAPSAVPRAANPSSQASGGDDAVSRLNELFPEDDSNFMPNNDDITNILDRLLPDEDQPQGKTAKPDSGPTGHSSSSARLAALNNPVAAGFSVFLAKITDEAKRVKVVPLLVELTGMSNNEADALSKKVIIPVLKGISKEEAEAAKQKFAKIGILARIKGP